MAASADGPNLSADEALARLLAGNARFVAGESRMGSLRGFRGFRRESLAELAAGQHPFATILGCSDSRVPPECVFDAGLGELFVVRVAGNVLSPEVAGSLQYAGSHLSTPLFVVLGHEGCGAVSAALASRDAGQHFRSRIEILLASIIPALPPADPGLPAAEQLSRAVEANVRWTVRQIVESSEGRARVAEGRMKVIGAVYEIKTGAVRILEDGVFSR